jgi:hypothetical protein
LTVTLPDNRLTNQHSLLYLGLIIGTFISEIFFSGSLSDWMVIKLAKSNNNQKTPEMRLWLAYPAAILTAVGLIVWGISVDQGYHWMVGQVAFALCKSPLPPLTLRLVQVHVEANDCFHQPSWRRHPDG